MYNELDNTDIKNRMSITIRALTPSSLSTEGREVESRKHPSSRKQKEWSKSSKSDQFYCHYNDFETSRNPEATSLYPHVERRYSCK